MRIRTHVINSMQEVAAAEWNQLVADDDPFTEHAFLAALEQSGTVGIGTSWIPVHLLLRDESERLVGAAPLYLKHDSFGEFIFDWAWAEASEAAGVPYYPKLVSAVPFTPVTGRRLLVRPGLDPVPVYERMVESLRRVAERVHVSSVHLLFLTDTEHKTLRREHDLIPRVTYQFHWANEGYRDFDHYLSTFRSAARKAVRRERRRVRANGLTLTTLRGEELTDEHWRALHSFYLLTTNRRWGRAYLPPAFFEQVQRDLAHRVLATFAIDNNGRPVAGALFFHRGGHLYGRYWGCLESYDSLHFELCYYRPIELCIAEGWTHFEAGAQGIHKLRRGLMPTPTYSVHWIEHPALRHAVGEHVALETITVRQQMRNLSRHGPFKREQTAAPDEIPRRIPAA